MFWFKFKNLIKKKVEKVVSFAQLGRRKKLFFKSVLKAKISFILIAIHRKGDFI